MGESETADTATAGYRLALAVNSHGWEDFPVHHRGQQAAELLAGWTSLWHPDLLQHCQWMPAWQRIDEMPDPPAGAVVVVPRFAASLVPTDAQQRLTGLGGHYVTGDADRNIVVRDLAERLPQTGGNGLTTNPADFFALGYCYLQVQLMTRQLRYLSTLDEAAFQQRLLAAARSAVAGQSAEARASLQCCFDLLAGERNRYYPTEAALIDCQYLYDPLPVAELARSLQAPHRFSLHLNGQRAGQIREQADLGAPVRQRLQAGSLSLVCGPNQEWPTALISLRSVCRELAASVAGIRRAFPETSTGVYGRRRFGLGPSTPAIIRLAGLRQAVHCTLDDGVFPQTAPNHIRWRGEDGTVLEALTSPPRLADVPETWLNLGICLGETIDSAHYASLFVVRWPGQESDGWVDVINSNGFGNILGRFVTLDEYFEQTHDPGFDQDYSPDQYRNPWLTQMVQRGEPDPVSRFLRYWQGMVGQLAREGMQAMLVAVTDKAGPPPGEPAPDPVQQWMDPASSSGGDPDPVPGEPGLPKQLAGHLARLPGEAPAAGNLLINPFSFSRPWLSDTAGMVHLPAMGCVREPPDPAPPAATTVPMVVDERTLRNEFFLVEINRETGGIAAIKLHNQRGSLLSQQLAVRRSPGQVSRGGSRPGLYTSMVASEVEIGSDGPWRAVARSRGHLVDEGRPVGEFRQQFTIERGIPWLTLESEVDLDKRPGGDPWDNYLACRIAWHDETADLFAWVHETCHPVNRHRLTAPLALDIRQPRATCSLLTGGLPFHQRIGQRRLDSILVAGNDSGRLWKTGIGINLDNPLTAALALIRPPESIACQGGPQSGWLFHLNCKNVVVLHWAPLAGPDGPALRLLVRETAGRAAEVCLESARLPVAARWIDLQGEILNQLKVQGNQVHWNMNPHETGLVELLW